MQDWLSCYFEYLEKCPLEMFDLLLKHAKGLSNIIIQASALFVTLLVHLQLENPLGSLKIQGWMTSMRWQKSSAAVVGVLGFH